MAFSLSVKQHEDREEWAQKVRAQAAKIRDVEATINDQIDGMIANDLIPEIDRFNELLKEAKTFCEEVGDKFRETYDGKSEKWQESDAGSAAVDFVTSWEDVSLDDMEHPEAPKLELSGDPEDAAQTLDDLPDQAE